MTGTSANSFILSDQPPSARASSTSTAQRQAGSTTEVALNAEQLRMAWAALTHRFVRMCLNEISKRLFSGRGISVHRGDRPQTPTDVFSTFLKRDMLPFARDALNCLLVMGVVPIAFRKPRMAGLGEGELAPYVPEYGTYTITVRAEAGLRRYAFYWGTETSSTPTGLHYSHARSGDTSVFGIEDKRVIIAHDFGYDPLINGTLTSNMAAIASELAMAGELQQLLMVGERIAANPPLISAYNPAIDSATKSPDAETGFFAGDLDACQNQEDFTFRRDAAAQRRRADELRAYAAVTGHDPRVEFKDGSALLRNTHELYRQAQPSGLGVDYSGAEMPWEPSRTHRLPVTDQHVAHQLPRTRSDYTQINEQVMRVVCGVLNVPQGLLASASTVKAGVEATAEAMHRTISSYADILSDLMTNVYKHIFGVSDLRDELRVRAERKRRTPYDLAPQLLTEADLFEARRASSVRLTFDLPPTTNMESLNFLRNSFLISHQTYAEAALRLNGFAASDLDTTRDKYTESERKTLILGQPRQTTSKGPSQSASSQSSAAAHKEASKSSTEQGKSANEGGAMKRSRTE